MDQGLVIRMERAVERLEGVVEKQADHEARLRVLEEYRWKLVGAVAAATVVMGILLKFL